MAKAKNEIIRVTTKTLKELKQKGEKISMLTAYDYSLAKIIDASGIEALLVGDSASNVIAGHETTLPITLDQMIYHASAVVKAAKRALVVVDIPFGSYQGSSSQALKSAIRIMKESGAHGVKMEGGLEIKDSVMRVLSAGVPVMGHLGLMPQSIYKFGTYAVRARSEEEANKLVDDALEVLVMHDLLGINKDFNPRFLRRYADLNTEITKAVKNYIRDIKSGSFPSEQESY
jgi:3-methyl-2-oxobutanoate hydroxymethyltransferase